MDINFMEIQAGASKETSTSGANIAMAFNNNFDTTKIALTPFTYEILGDGNKRVFTSAGHGKDTNVPNVKIYDVSTGARVYTTVVVPNSDQITISFYNPPILGKKYTVTVE